MKNSVGIEYIRVFVRFENGKSVCICPREKKLCKRRCIPDVVERDKFRGWEDAMKQDKYGKSRL